MPDKDESSSDEDSTESLILYHQVGSPCCQKVLMALHEKNLSFESNFIDTFSGEQMEPFFMKLNPKGEVPVLVDGDRVISESHKIIEYLDEKYSEGNCPRLIPKGTTEAERVMRVIKLVQQVPLPTIIFGTIYHTQLAVNPKITETERNIRLNVMKNMNTISEAFIIKYPEYEAKYKEKREKFRQLFSAIQDINVVRDAIKKIEKTLDIIEEELDHNKDDWWLCGQNFTYADISVVVLLHCIDHVGLTSWFFHDGARPKVMKYYERVQHRSSFIEAFALDFCDDDPPGNAFSYTTLFVTLGLIVFVICAACAHLKNH